MSEYVGAVSKEDILPTPANTSSDTYTTFHLSALTFSHPANPPPITQCPCEAQTGEEQIKNPNKQIRVYYNEPSGYAYNSDSYHIKESRYSTVYGWHGPSDDLVADDAKIGSAVVVVGRWQEKGESDEETWKTNIYYIDKNSNLAERTNRSVFAPAVHEEFESELPKPEELIMPTPGWKKTSLAGDGDKFSFPTISPLNTTKLAAAYSDDGSIHVFFQYLDESIWELISDPVRGWSVGQADGTGEGARAVIGSGKAKRGTPLAVVAGGWKELRLFFVDKADQLKELYSNDHTGWVASDIPLYNVHPTAMLTAVAWNHASAHLQIRLFSTTNSDNLREFSFSRNDVGWAPERSVSNVVPPNFVGPEAPLSAVSAVLLEGEWKPKVYYYPRRPFVAEWDVCAKTPVYAGILRASTKAIEKRRIEEETRVKIREDEERKRLEEEERIRQEEEAKRLEEERIRQEEEAKRLEEERIRQEEEAKRLERERIKKEEEENKKQAKLQPPKNLSTGGTFEVSDPAIADKLQKISKCNQGFVWKKEDEGWRCGGGAHFIPNAVFESALN